MPKIHRGISFSLAMVWLGSMKVSFPYIYLNTHHNILFISYTHYSRMEDFDPQDTARGRLISTGAHEATTRDELQLRSAKEGEKLVEDL